MTRRKQHLILFFQENEECNVISSRLVRLYMNRFTIDEDDETEVTQVHNVKNGTWEEYKKCFSKSLVIAKESETPKTDYHFIIGYSTVNDDKKLWYTKMLPFFRSETDSLLSNFDRLVEYNKSRLVNGFALTVLHGSKSLKKFSANHQKMAYQYQNQGNKLDQKFLAFKKFWHSIKDFMSFYGMHFITERFERSINDDLEWFYGRIHDFGINNTNLSNEYIQTFHYQMQDDDQMKYLKNSMDKHNNQSFFKRLHAFYSMEKTDSNDFYARFNCTRVTMYSNNRTLKTYIFLVMQNSLNQLLYQIINIFSRTTSESVLVIMILGLLMFNHNYHYYFDFVNNLISQFAFYTACSMFFKDDIVFHIIISIGFSIGISISSFIIHDDGIISIDSLMVYSIVITIYNKAYSYYTV